MEPITQKWKKIIEDAANAAAKPCERELRIFLKDNLIELSKLNLDTITIFVSYPEWNDNWMEGDYSVVLATESLLNTTVRQNKFIDSIANVLHDADQRVLAAFFAPLERLSNKATISLNSDKTDIIVSWIQ